MDWVNSFDYLVYSYLIILVGWFTFILGFIVGWLLRRFIVKPLPTLKEAVDMHTLSMRDYIIRKHTKPKRR